MEKFIYVVVLIMNISTVTYAQSIGQICGIENLRGYKTVTDMSQSLCDLATVLKDQPQAVEFIHTVVNVLKHKKKELSKEGQNEPIPFYRVEEDLGAGFRDGLNELSRLTNLHFRPNMTSENPIGRILNKLYVSESSLSTPSDRASKKKEYFDTLIELIGSTESGRKIVDCYESKVKPSVKEKLGKEIVETISSDGSLASYSSDVNGSSIVTASTFKDIAPAISVSPDRDPIFVATKLTALISGLCEMEKIGESKNIEVSAASHFHVAHTLMEVEVEKQSASYALPFFGNKSEVDKMDNDLTNYMKENFPDIYQGRIAGEINGLEVFREIAKANPSIACNYHYVSGEYGKLISVGEYHAQMEKLVENGLFPGHYMLNMRDDFSSMRRSHDHLEGIFRVTDYPGGSSAVQFNLNEDYVKQLNSAGIKTELE